MNEAVGWVEALRVLTGDPNASVPCPVCGDADLQARWLAASDGSGRGEVELRCPACGAVNYALATARPDNL